MTKRKKLHKKYKKYFVKNSTGICVIDYDYFDSVKSWMHAFAIGISCYNEIQNTLMTDIDDQDSYIGNMKVITGLERSLQELNERYPCLMMEIHKAPLKINRC